MTHTHFNHTLTDSIIPGVVSSLNKKGFIVSDGKGQDAVISLTAAGALWAQSPRDRLRDFFLEEENARMQAIATDKDSHHGV